MDYILSATNSRHEIENYELDSFDENILGIDRYSFDGSIILHLSDDFEVKSRQIGLVRATFFDEYMICRENAGSLAKIADMIDPDTSKAFRALLRSDVHRSQRSPGYRLPPLHSCYISTFWVDPEYRMQGIGTHLLDNLYYIFQHMFSVYINCMVVYPNPATPKGGWKSEFEKTQERERLSWFFEKNEFKALGDSGFYVRCYVSEMC